MCWERSEYSMNYRKIWEKIGREDPYCGTGGPTRAIPKQGRFAQPDTTLFSLITRDNLVLDVGCGYGRNSIPLTRVLGCDLVAADISTTMSKTVREAEYPSCCATSATSHFEQISLTSSYVAQYCNTFDVPK